MTCELGRNGRLFTLECVGERERQQERPQGLTFPVLAPSQNTGPSQTPWAGELYSHRLLAWWEGRMGYVYRALVVVKAC
jgi:hypothetical protein